MLRCSLICFNTQPPEGGWPEQVKAPELCREFQHTAARRRLDGKCDKSLWFRQFQHTAARRRLDEVDYKRETRSVVSTHSRPKAAGTGKLFDRMGDKVSTHSRPKAAGLFKEWQNRHKLFQHTAARRRLEPLSKALLHQVSQP